MAIAFRPEASTLLADKAALQRLLEAQDQESGFVPDPTATPQKARALMLAEGIRPEENAFSREIIRLRDQE